MAGIDGIRRLLLISNSTLHGSGYLDHAEKEIREFIGCGNKVVFVPYAVHDLRAYAEKAASGSNLRPLFEESASPVGRVA